MDNSTDIYAEQFCKAYNFYLIKSEEERADETKRLAEELSEEDMSVLIRCRVKEHFLLVRMSEFLLALEDAGWCRYNGEDENTSLVLTYRQISQLFTSLADYLETLNKD